MGFGNLLDRAQKIGPNTAAVLTKQALNKKHLDETVRGARGILRLAQDFTPTALERACGTALKFNVFNYRVVRDLLIAGQKKAPKAVCSFTEDLVHENVRGAAYYGEPSKH